MSMRRGWVAGAAAGTVLLLAGCSTDMGGGQLTVGGATTAPRSAAASTAGPASAEPSAAAPTVSMSVPAGTTPGAAGEGNPYGTPTEATAAAPGTGESAAGGSTGGESAGGSAAAGLDDTSLVWFETVCQGLAPLPGQEQQALAATDIGTAATVLSAATATVNDTAGSLNQLAPPTIDGGPALATAVAQGLSDFGQTLSDFGARAAELSGGDPAGFQQFGGDLQSALASTSPLGDARLPPEVAAQVRAVPGCGAVFGS